MLGRSKKQVDEPVANQELVEALEAKVVEQDRQLEAERIAKGGKRKAKAKEEEVFSIPSFVNIEFYRGVEKISEAELLARAFIENNYPAPNACYYMCVRWKDGIAVEMQQGGGRAFLPEVLQKLDEEPDATVIVVSSNRVMQVFIDPESETLSANLLPAQEAPSEDAFVALPGMPMKAYDQKGWRLGVTAIALMGVSFVALLFSAGGFFVDKNTWAAPYLRQASVESLADSKAANDAIKLAMKSGDCVYKLDFSGSVWKATKGFNVDGECAPKIPGPGDAPSAGATAGAVPGPAAGAAPGAVPAAAPGAAPGAATTDAGAAGAAKPS